MEVAAAMGGQGIALGSPILFSAELAAGRLVQTANARGGLDKQTVILPLMGKLTMDVLDVELAPNSTPILVGKQPLDLGALAIPIPSRESSCCACRR